MRAVLTLNPSVQTERREVLVTVTSIPILTIVATIRLYQRRLAKELSNVPEALLVWGRTA